MQKEKQQPSSTRFSRVLLLLTVMSVALVGASCVSVTLATPNCPAMSEEALQGLVFNNHIPPASTEFLDEVLGYCEAVSEVNNGRH